MKQTRECCTIPNLLWLRVYLAPIVIQTIHRPKSFMYLGGGYGGTNFKSAKYLSNNFAVGYVHMHFATLSQMPELFYNVSAFTIMPPTEMTIFALKLDLWCFVIFGFSKAEATTQILAFLNIYMEINLPDFKFQPEALPAFALCTLLYHREVYRALESFSGSPSFSVQPHLWT